MTEEEFTAFKQSEDVWDLDDTGSSEDGSGEFDVIPYHKLTNHTITPYLIYAAKVCRRRLKNSIPPPSNTRAYAAESKSGAMTLFQWREARSRSLVRGQRNLLQQLIESVQE